mmetsp:Transcript_34434/g.63491  ORF Transcript_34434/g.63491 Transcript_34434/m.63491 type:complete len:278 (+) Transcript_34434:48-881(+)
MPSATPAITTPCLPVETEEQTPSLPTQQQFVCYMCCDKVSTNESIILTACSHRGCNSCTTKWIKKQEDSGQATSATCPYCRASTHDDDVIAILGRPFKQREALTRPANEEIDDLTLQWFNDQTKLCPGCGSRVEKLDGCDHMTCLCGCKFCFECGEVRCICADDGVAYEGEEEPIRDDNGIVNQRLCMLRRNGRRIRVERAQRRCEKMTKEDNRWRSTTTTIVLSSTIHAVGDGFSRIERARKVWQRSCNCATSTLPVLIDNVMERGERKRNKDTKK